MSIGGPECLYYSHPDLDEAEAVLVDVGAGGRELVLDRTIFYPEGGGQPCDLGSIDGLGLESVLEISGTIIHRLATPLQSAPGTRLRLVLDRGRRRDHTEQHSAQHLLSGFLYKNHGIATISFHLGAERSTIDVDASEFPESLVEEVESEVNMAIADARPFVVHLCPPEDIESLPLRRPPPGEEKILRIWEIAGLDFSPCCGTHVASASELRIFKIHAAERYKGKTRIHFSAGGRALEDYSRLHRSVAAACRVLSTPPEALAEGAERLVRKSRESSVKADRLLGSLVAHMVEHAAKETPICLDLGGTGADGIDEGMRALREGGLFGVVSLAETSTVGVVGAGGKALPPELLAAVKEKGGRGGGGPGTLRATFADGAAAVEFAVFALDILGNGR
ncbi:MAG TPA: alanyl-tRNA editing protein [Rectinemataceae bacterium]|nr:alanyl-tRNA editing protein [Rectinemataceae bacterium]